MSMCFVYVFGGMSIHSPTILGSRCQGAKILIHNGAEAVLLGILLLVAVQISELLNQNGVVQLLCVQPYIVYKIDYV